MKVTKEMILVFLQTVDKDFPIPISEKTDLESYAEKLFDRATICAEVIDNHITGMVAGYVKNTINRGAYIALVATLPEARKKGIARKLVNQFILIAKSANLQYVHLYTDNRNSKAISLYTSIGFQNYIIEDETRKEDVHLIYII